MKGYKKVIQKYEKTLEADSPNDTGIEIWADTAWYSIEKAQANYPKEKYREVQIKIEKE